jgi:hypothetical protein
VNARRRTPYSGGRRTEPFQHNQHNGRGDLYANQGDGPFTVNHNTSNMYESRRGVAGRIVLVLLVIDVIWFIWGMTAYTGGPDDRGDSVRAVGFLILFFLTCAFGGAWFRRRL